MQIIQKKNLPHIIKLAGFFELLWIFTLRAVDYCGENIWKCATRCDSIK